MISVSFNFLTSLIIFFAILLPIFVLFINKVLTHTNKKDNKIAIKLSIPTIEFLVTTIIIIFIISSAFDLIQNKISLHTLIILTTMISISIIIFFTNINYNIKIRIYLLIFFIIILTYVLLTSAINSWQPYYNDDIRDIIAVDSIITNNKIDYAQTILKETEPYYSTIPLFQLLLTILTYVTSNINYSYIFVGIIQLVGIIFGIPLITAVINNNDAKYTKKLNSVLSSLFIIGLPYGFFTIIATQPQSISLIFLALVIYTLMKIIKNKENNIRSYLVLFIIFIFFANIYHAIISILLILFISIYYITNYSNIRSILGSKFLSVIILASLLVIIYWYDMSSMLRIHREVNRLTETLFTFNINNLPQSSEEYLTKGFKSYAYSFAFLLAINLALLIVWSFYKFQVNKVNIKGIFDSLNIGLALVVIIIAALAFISVANPIYSGLNRYLIGQGGIFLLSSVVASTIIIILINLSKRIFIIVISMLFIYNLSGLVQPYWIPDYTFSSYSTYTNYENIRSIYEKLDNDNILYLYSNIPIIYKITDYDELKLYKLKADYTGLSRKFLNNEPLFYNISSPSQSVINIHMNEGINNIIIESNRFNVIFMSNRYTGFYTTPSMIK